MKAIRDHRRVAKTWRIRSGMDYVTTYPYLKDGSAVKHLTIEPLTKAVAKPARYKKIKLPMTVKKGKK